MPITYLQPEHHAIRYVSWTKLRKDEDGKVLGVLGAAFRLRDGEEYLSATWVEFYKGPHNDCISAAIRTIRNSKIDVKPRSGFAVGKVANIRDVCLADKKRVRIRFIHDPEDDNQAHAALRGWPHENDDLLELIAEDAWGSVVLNADVPA